MSSQEAASILIVDDRPENLLALEAVLEPLDQTLVKASSGVEALVRWDHPRRGVLEPAKFLPIAEQMGLMPSIGAWVMTEACRQVALWHAGYPEAKNLTVAINLSPSQLRQPDLIAVVVKALGDAHIDAGAVCFEITEGALMSEMEASAAALRELKALGVTIAIDDFGTGHSSLAHLKGFPIDILKVDRSFIEELGHDPQSEAITDGIVTLARSLNLMAVAEGVETIEQLEHLRRLGSGYGQGYYFARPQTPDSIGEMLGVGPPRDRETAAGPPRDRKTATSPSGAAVAEKQSDRGPSATKPQSTGGLRRRSSTGRRRRGDRRLRDGGPDGDTHVDIGDRTPFGAQLSQHRPQDLALGRKALRRSIAHRRPVLKQ